MHDCMPRFANGHVDGLATETIASGPTYVNEAAAIGAHLRSPVQAAETVDRCVILCRTLMDDMLGLAVVQCLCSSLSCDAQLCSG